MPDAQELLRKLQALPPERLGEVESFIDFLSAKALRKAALDQLLAVAPALEVAGAPALTEDDMQAEVKAARDARPARGGGANRS